MPVEYLGFTDVGPFDAIKFKFDQHVNVLTGPNNSGKSTVLLVLAEILVFPFGMPHKLLRSDDSNWELGIRGNDGKKQSSGSLPASPDDVSEMMGSLGYTCFVPAQRHSTDFRSSGPTATRTVQGQVQARTDSVFGAERRAESRINPNHWREALWERVQTENPDFAKRAGLMPPGPSVVSDEDVIQKIVDLDYAAYRRRRPEIRKTIDMIGSIASEITDEFPISFLGVDEDDLGLFPKIGTPSGELPLDVLSQGTQSVFHCIARLVLGYSEYYDFPNDLTELPGIVIVDEIDAHLHPSWQRRFIPALTGHLPNLQIFCSTHSPLMLSGLSKGQVQLLRRDAAGKVSVSANESDIDGWTADEVLRNLLGINNPTDLDSVRKLDRLRELRNKTEISPDELVELEELQRSIGQGMMRGPRLTSAAEFAAELRNAIRNDSPLP